MLTPPVKRSACDQCRTKRVRCLRAQDSTAPCARCSYMGARCVTGAPGHPGRPPKRRLAASSPKLHRTTLRNMACGQAHPQDVTVVPAPATIPKSAAHPHSSRELISSELQPDLWAAPGDISAFLNSPSPSMDHSPALGEDIFSPADQSCSSSQLQGLLNADEEFDAMLRMGETSVNALDMYIDPLLGLQNDDLHPSALSQCSSTASSMLRFREEMDQRIATIDAYYSDSTKVVQRCKDEGGDRDVENPAALLLASTKEFTDMIQNLTKATRTHTQGEDTLSTETVLLVLSSYLALMRLFDTLFHRIFKYLCQVSPESYQSIKVKSVLRIGGISSLQDMPLKTYAIGILDAIQSQVQTLERSMGIPSDYCLSHETEVPCSTAVPGMFSSAQRAQLFWAVMAQEDVKSRLSSKSYVESIRASIKDSLAFLHD